MIILGITHPASTNPAACLLVDGKLMSFAEEERFVRLKHAPNMHPAYAIQYCLEMAGVKSHQVDVTAIGFGIPKVNSLTTEEVNGFINGTLPLNQISRVLSNTHMLYHTTRLQTYGRRNYYDHHTCHAASAFIPSGFKSCNVMTLDGWGGEHSSGVLGHFKESGDFQVLKNIPPANSWGILYELVTQALGFRMHSAEGKTMGLAPYGKPNPQVLPDWCDEEWGLPDIEKFKKFILETYPPREKTAPLTELHKDLAATVQFYYERSLIKMARWLQSQTGLRKYVLAGGVALNCTGNGELAQQEFVDEIFVQPASHDAGTALGAALLAHREMTGEWPQVHFSHAYWGPSYTQDQILDRLKFANVPFQEVDPAEATSKALQQDFLVGLFQGRAEVGPRALGNRSILANPMNAENLKKVNASVKKRELWRPFAPSVLKENYFEVFDAKVLSPFMILAFQANSQWAPKIPAVVHVDGSARPQSVMTETNPIYHAAIQNFYKATDVPVVLNTSFNLDDEPIVNSPEHALATFFRCGLDRLVIGNFMVSKTKI